MGDVFRELGIHSVTIDNLVVGVAGNALYGLIGFVAMTVVFLIKAWYIYITRNEFESIEGRWFLYLGRRNSDKEAPNVAHLYVRKALFRGSVQATWQLESISRSKTKGVVRCVRNRYLIIFDNKTELGFCVVLIEYGTKNDRDIKIGFQTGFLYTSGSAYTCRAIASRKKLRSSDVEMYLMNAGMQCLDVRDAKSAIELFNSDQGNLSS